MECVVLTHAIIIPQITRNKQAFLTVIILLTLFFVFLEEQRWAGPKGIGEE